MRLRRPLATPSIEPLEPLFERIRADAGVEEGYPPDAYFEAEHGPARVFEEDPPHIVGERVDATDVPLVTIDPAGSRDLDQAVHIERRGGAFRVRYAIADLAAHVAPGGALDDDTRRRGVTVYCPDRRVGLHPPVLGEGRASLLPGQRTKAVLWTLDLDSAGELETIDVRRTWVTSRRQYSFTELENSPSVDDRPILAGLAAVGEKRRAIARARGAVTMPRPSQEVVVSKGKVGLEFRAGSALEDDNAQISLLTGEAAARLMLNGGIGVLRVLPPAEPEAIERLRRQAAALGVHWHADESYGQVLRRLDPSSPHVAAFLAHAAGLYRGARWAAFDDDDPALPRPENTLHGALAVSYAHVTAPIRRLVDRFAAEICLALAASRDVPRWVKEALPSLGDTMLATDRRGRGVELRCVNGVEAAILVDHVGEEFTGIGLDGHTVQLERAAIVARCTGTIKVGVEQRVRLVAVDPERGPSFEAIG